MEQLPMHKRSIALAVMVAIAFTMAIVIGYLIHVNHSTISSLNSELSKKDQMILTKDNLIQEKDAIIDQSTTQVQKKEKEVEEKSQQIEEKVQQVEALQKQVSLKLERQKDAQREASLVKIASTSAPKVIQTSLSEEAKSQFQDGWKATFYNAGVESTGKRPGDRGYGLTASGRTVQDGVTISVDPKVIPLGSWVEIQYPDGTVEKRRADDTGGAIKGRRIDIYANDSNSNLNKRGHPSIKVRVLKGDQSV